MSTAHVIRHQRTKQFRAVSTITAKHRWCLTGTPIQNKLDDLGALVQFLRVPLLETSTLFRYHIVSPVELGNTTGFSRLRQLLKSLCLRRTNHLLNLPEPVTLHNRLELSEIEGAQYANVSETFRQTIDRAVSGREVAKAYNGILKAILRLRLLCNHGTYDQSTEASSDVSPEYQDEALALLQQSDNAICAICACDVPSVGNLAHNDSGIFTVCRHLLCQDCVLEYEARLKEGRRGKKFQCPVCQNLISENFLTLKERGRRQMRSQLPASVASTVPSTCFDLNAGYSSKMTMLLKDIESHMHKDKR